MRDDFKARIKNILASRVAYRCSFPGCNRVTIGPGHNNHEHVIKIGDAAHIYSASPSGPRNNPELSLEERASVKNGIWMCKNHARLIDVDVEKYTAETLLQWKISAEKYAYNKLETLEKEEVEEPYTLIMLNVHVIFKAVWIYVDDEVWEFKMLGFVEGSITTLLAFINGFCNLLEHQKYVIIESQGDGRVVKSLSYRIENDIPIVSCKILPQIPRTNPHESGSDLAIGDDGDLVLDDNDLGSVHGVDYALQSIRTMLSWEFGWWANPLLGSNFPMFFNKYRSNPLLLNSLTKLEIVRLFTVPMPTAGVFVEIATPVLNFIKRVDHVEVLTYDESKPFVPIKLSLEWGNGEYYQGELKIPMNNQSDTIL